MEQHSYTLRERLKRTIYALIFLGVITILLARFASGSVAFVFAIVSIVFTYKNVWNEKVTREDLLVQEENKRTRELMVQYGSKYGTRIKISLAILALVCLGAYVATHTLVLPLVIVLFYVVGLLTWFGKLKQANAESRHVTFAEKFGFTYSFRGDPASVDQMLISGTYTPERSKISNVFAGTLEGYPIRIFDWYFVFAKNAAYEVTMLEVVTLAYFPPMLILSKADEFAGTMYPSKMFNGVKARLEGDFNEYFDVYIASDAQTEVRQILTPDVMVKLIDTMSEFSFYFSANRFYVVLSPALQGGVNESYFKAQLEKARGIIQKWSVEFERIGR